MLIIVTNFIISTFWNLEKTDIVILMKRSTLGPGWTSLMEIASEMGTAKQHKILDHQPPPGLRRLRRFSVKRSLNQAIHLTTIKKCLFMRNAIYAPVLYMIKSKKLVLCITKTST